MFSTLSPHTSDMVCKTVDGEMLPTTWCILTLPTLNYSQSGGRVCASTKGLLNRVKSNYHIEKIQTPYYVKHIKFRWELAKQQNF